MVPVGTDPPSRLDGSETGVTVIIPVKVSGPSGPPQGDRTRRAVGVVGEVFITLGVLLLLLCVYQLWWTNVESAKATDVVRDEISSEWETTPVIKSATGGKPGTIARPASGKGFAFLYIPRINDKVWRLPVIQGTSLSVLAEGAGHYTSSALPGQVGNFAVAAHRATHNEPFRDIDAIKPGDKVYVETKAGWYTYVLDLYKIVKPTDTWVINPVPSKTKETPTKALITLTTCNPRWASYERWIWWGHLTKATAKSDGPPDGINPRSA